MGNVGFKMWADQEIISFCQEYGGNAKLWLRRFAVFVPEVYRRRLYRKLNFVSIHEFAKKLAGMNERTVDRIIGLASRLEDLPALRALFESAEVGWSKIKCVAFVATPENEAVLAGKVLELAKRDLEIFVQNMRSVPGDQVENNIERCKRLTFPVSVEVELRLRGEKQVMEKRKKRRLTWNEFFYFYVPERGRRVVEKICPVCVNVSNIKKLMKARYGVKCAFPGCNRPWDHIHHVKRYALFKENDPEFMVPLCVSHHHLAHHGLIGNEEKDPKYWFIMEKSVETTLKSNIDKKVQKHIKPPLQPRSSP